MLDRLSTTRAKTDDEIVLLESRAVERQLAAWQDWIPKVDALANQSQLDLASYVSAASECIRTSHSYTPGQKKAAQIRLSDALARVLSIELRARLGPAAGDVHAGERMFSGVLRRARLDVSEFHELDGLRLAVELEPVNLAVGRVVWNRFGDNR